MFFKPINEYPRQQMRCNTNPKESPFRHSAQSHELNFHGTVYQSGWGGLHLFATSVLEMNKFILRLAIN